jgi:hypothetical protein
MSGFRAGKSGDAYRTEQKFEQKYDEEEKLGTPAAIITWIQKIVGNECTFPGQDWQSIHNHLKDGVVLCKLINALNTFAGKPTQSFKAKATSSFVAMANIENFNTGCKDFGVPQTALFQTTDLYEGRKAPMLNVINCLNQLGFVANSKGFNPKYEGPAPPKGE